MYARALLIGKIKNLEYVKENSFPSFKIILEVKRPFINLMGEVETDFFKIKTTNEFLDSFDIKLDIGDLISVNALLLTKKVKLSNGEVYKEIVIKTERITILSKACRYEENQNENISR